MSKSRKIDISDHEAKGLSKVVPPLRENLAVHWNEIQTQLNRIKDDYWAEMKEQVERLKLRQNSAVAVLPAEVFLKSTFIVYRPVMRVGGVLGSQSMRLTWAKAKFRFLKKASNGSKTATEHITMTPSQSNLMPSYYHHSRFQFPAEAEWQKEIVLRYEKEIAHYRVLAFKIQIAAKEITSIDNQLAKLFDNQIEVTDPNTSSQVKTDKADSLMDASEALRAAHDDINSIPREFAELLMNTESEVLESYNIDPDIKLMYMRNL